MDFNLSEDQLAFQEAARAFAQGEMAPLAAEWDEKKIFPILLKRSFSNRDNLAIVSFFGSSSSFQMGVMEVQTPSPLIRDHSAAPTCIAMRA